MLRVLLLAEESFYREALARALAQEGLGTITVASTAFETAAEVKRGSPDVILLDISSPREFDAIHMLAAEMPETRLIALGVPEDGRKVISCIEAGATGYVPRGASLSDLADRVRRAARGEPVASPEVVAALMRRVASLAAESEHTDLRILTSRECEVVRLLEKGLSNKEIAAHLSIEVTTVKNHVHRILEKLSVHRRGEAAALVRGSAAPLSQSRF